MTNPYEVLPCDVEPSTTMPPLIAHQHYAILPEHGRTGMRRYFEQHINPGGFLRALLNNDLLGSFKRADDINLPRIHDYVTFLYAHAPCDSWGSVESVKKWVASSETIQACDVCGLVDHHCRGGACPACNLRIQEAHG